MAFRRAIVIAADDDDDEDGDVNDDDSRRRWHILALTTEILEIMIVRIYTHTGIVVREYGMWWVWVCVVRLVFSYAMPGM